MPEKVKSSTQVFKSHFVNNKKDSYINKIYKKSHLVIYTYNDTKNNLIIIHSSKIPKISKGIGFCFAVIILDHKNDNIRFYLWDIK